MPLLDGPLYVFGQMWQQLIKIVGIVFLVFRLGCWNGLSYKALCFKLFLQDFLWNLFWLKCLGLVVDCILFEHAPLGDWYVCHDQVLALLSFPLGLGFLYWHFRGCLGYAFRLVFELEFDLLRFGLSLLLFMFRRNFDSEVFELHTL